MIAASRRSSTTLIATGVLAVLFGIVASIWPIGTFVSLVIIWGAYALVDGITALVMAFSREGSSAKLLPIFTGVIGVVAGLYAIFQPLSSGVALAWAMGIWLVVRGVTELISAFAEALSSPRWMLIIGGILWILAGVLFIANPGAAALTVAFWLGALAFVWGLLTIGAGIALRSHLKKASAADAA